MIGVQSPRFPFGADPRQVAAGPGAARGRVPGRDRRRARALAAPTAARAGPASSSGAIGGALTWFHFGEGEYLATEMAIQEELRELDALRSLPEPMAPLRPERRAGRPGDGADPRGLPRRLLGAALDRGRGRRGAGAGVRGGRRLRDGRGRGRALGRASTAPSRAAVADHRPRRSTHLAEHQRHEAHTVALRPDPGLRVWSVSFVPACPDRVPEEEEQ